MTYRDELIEKSNERLKALMLEVSRLDERKSELKGQIAQVRQVLKVLGAEDRIEIAARDWKPEDLIPSSGLVPVKSYDGKTRNLQQSVIDTILTWGRFRTWQVTDLSRHGEDALYIRHLLGKGLIKRVKHGVYEVVRTPLPPQKDVIEDQDGNIHIVDGVVTMEKPDTRGYGH